MLNLKLLEKQLDEALDIETSESMTVWLLNRRLKSQLITKNETRILTPTNHEKRKTKQLFTKTPNRLYQPFRCGSR